MSLNLRLAVCLASCTDTIPQPVISSCSRLTACIDCSCSACFEASIRIMDNTPVRGASYKHHGQRLECVLSLGIQVLVNKMQDTQEHIAVIFKTLSSSIRAPTLTETNCNRAWFQYNHIVAQRLRSRKEREGCSSFLRFVNVCCRQARLDMQVATEPLTGTTLHLRSNATTWAASESTVPVLQSCSFHLCHSCRVCRLNFFDSEA